MSQKTVLIVDDDDELHTLYGLYLKGASFGLMEAYNGQEAFELIAKQRPDLIVLDMIMPVMDGETFLRKLHGDDRYTDIPVIIASVNDKIAPELLDYQNVCSVLKKPFTIDLLTKTIQKMLGQ
ncbi:MAG: response regulator [Candidatus Omnitrophica bacterium]|nr:response regulator [Candidatus Omnitrophota bacterium]